MKNLISDKLIITPEHLEQFKWLIYKWTTVYSLPEYVKDYPIITTPTITIEEVKTKR